MAKDNPYEAILTTSGAARKQVTQEVYDDAYREHATDNLARLPSKSRRKKIAVLCAAIGRGHKSILELGCGIGDLTWALVDCGEKIIGVDVSAEAIESAKQREGLWRLAKEQAARSSSSPCRRCSWILPITALTLRSARPWSSTYTRKDLAHPLSRGQADSQAGRQVSDLVPQRIGPSPRPHASFLDVVLRRVDREP